MKSNEIAEINLEDIFADINLELEEINSTTKIICSALENSLKIEPDTQSIENVLFMLQGKLSTVKNNLKYCIKPMD